MNAKTSIWQSGSTRNSVSENCGAHATAPCGRRPESGAAMSVANHQVDVFLFAPESDRYLGRLCSFSQCPKGKDDCLVPGCGAIPFNKRIADFKPHADLLAGAAEAMLYQSGVGRLRSALDLPRVDQDYAT